MISYKKKDYLIFYIDRFTLKKKILSDIKVFKNHSEKKEGNKILKNKKKYLNGNILYFDDYMVVFLKFSIGLDLLLCRLPNKKINFKNIDSIYFYNRYILHKFFCLLSEFANLFEIFSKKLKVYLIDEDKKNFFAIKFDSLNFNDFISNDPKHLNIDCKFSFNNVSLDNLVTIDDQTENLVSGFIIKKNRFICKKEHLLNYLSSYSCIKPFFYNDILKLFFLWKKNKFILLDNKIYYITNLNNNNLLVNKAFIDFYFSEFILSIKNDFSLINHMNSFNFLERDKCSLGFLIEDYVNMFNLKEFTTDIVHIILFTIKKSFLSKKLDFKFTSEILSIYINFYSINNNINIIDAKNFFDIIYKSKIISFFNIITYSSLYIFSSKKDPYGIRNKIKLLIKNFILSNRILNFIQIYNKYIYSIINLFFNDKKFFKKQIIQFIFSLNNFQSFFIQYIFFYYKKDFKRILPDNIDIKNIVIIFFSQIRKENSLFFLQSLEIIEDYFSSENQKKILNKLNIYLIIKKLIIFLIDKIIKKKLNNNTEYEKIIIEKLDLDKNIFLKNIFFNKKSYDFSFLDKDIIFISIKEILNIFV